MKHAGIEIQVVDSLAGLIGLADDWRAVQDACEHEHVFLDHRFATAWWRHFGSGKQMHTLVLRRRGEVLGIVPLVCSRGWEAYPARGKLVRIAEDYDHLPSLRWRRVVPIRRLSFPLNFASSNVRSHLLLRRPEPDLIAAVLGYCHSIRARWDILFLDGIPHGSEQERLLAELAPGEGLYRGLSRYARTMLHASLPETMDRFLAQRSGSFRRWLRRSCRQSAERTADLGPLEIREFRGDAIADGMSRLLGLERQSWKVKRTRRRPLHLSLNERSRSFYLDVAEAFAARDQAQVLVTEVGGQPANALLSLEREGTVTCLLTYQSEGLADRVAVAPLWQRFFELAIARGLRETDFNGDNSYLARYADGERRYDRLVFFHRAPYSLFLRVTADGVTRLGQTVRGRLRR